MKRRHRATRSTPFKSLGELRFEALEDRRLLAGDLVNSTFVNDSFSSDVVSLEHVIERTKSQSHVPGELLVAIEFELFDPHVQTVLELPWQNRLELGSRASIEPLISVSINDRAEYRLVRLDFGTDVNLIAAMQDLSGERNVLWSQPNFIFDGVDPREFTPNDPLYASQYHHALIGNDLAWDVTLGDSNIIIGITDDGVDVDHPDLSDAIWTNSGEIAGDGIDNDGNGYVDDIQGWNFLNNNNDVDADPGDLHGTHIAGVAAGVINNGIGTAGTAGGATIMPLKWYDGDIWTAASIVEAFTYAADNGVNIINTSYNMDFWATDPAVHAAFNYIYDAGVLHFNSAGNGNTLNPARQVFEQTLFVANTDSADVRSPSSNYGSGIDLAAPGVGILSTVPGGGYGIQTGTSIATPNAVGTAALIWSANPTWTREQVVAQLLNTTDSIDSSNASYVKLLGSGRINSGRSLTESIGAPQVTQITNVPETGLATSSDAVQSFHVDFNQFMDSTSVTDVASYELREAGADGVFETIDDRLHGLAVSSNYQVGTNGIDINVQNGPLGLGEYRLSIFSGGTTNPFGTPLDGDGDGIGGDNFETFFTIELEPFETIGLAGGLSAISGGNLETIVGSTNGHEFNAEAGTSITAIVTPLDPNAVLTAKFDGLSPAASAAAPGASVVIPITAVTSDQTITLDVSSNAETAYSFDLYYNVNVEDLASSSSAPINISDSLIPIGLSRYAAIGRTEVATSDEFSVALSAGAAVDILVEGLTDSLETATVELVDPNDTVVATAGSLTQAANVENPHQAISDFIIPDTGVYTIRIAAETVATYSLVVVEQGIYDLEPNNDVGSARSLDSVSGALGHLGLSSISHEQYNDPLAFVDISTTGTALNLGDEDEASITTAIVNPLFSSGAITVSNNGAIIANGDASAGRLNLALPYGEWQQALLPFWDDLVDSQGNVFWEETVLGGINTLIVQWHERSHFGGTGDVTFQVQLFESGPIAARFAYQDVTFGSGHDFGASATIGAQLNSTSADLVSHDTAAVANDDVIDFSLVESDIYAFTLASDQVATLATSTPFNQSPIELDPSLAILDSAGTVLASDANSAIDGRNAAISFSPPAAGTYYVSVGVEDGNGAYVLSYATETIVDGDFDNDGDYDCDDVNSLGVEVAAMSHNPAFDLTGDGLVDLADRDAWLAVAAADHGLLAPFLAADANLDGEVDGQDFLSWNANKFTNTSAYCLGDFDMNGFIDGNDFLIWNVNKFTSSDISMVAADASAVDSVMSELDSGVDQVAPEKLHERTAYFLAAPTPIGKMSSTEARRRVGSTRLVQPVTRFLGEPIESSKGLVRFSSGLADDDLSHHPIETETLKF